MSPTRDASQTMALRTWFGIDHRTACVLVQLVKAGGSIVQMNDLMIACGMSSPNLRYQIFMLRQAMDCEAVDRERGGYRLTFIGLEECRKAFEAMRADLEVAA